MKVLIADDHDVVRRGLKQILEEEFHAIKFGEARNAEEAIALASKQTWDVVILDINMPGKSGFEAMKEIRAARPKLPILILSVQPEDQYAIPVLKAGASGYLTKDSASAELVNAFKKVASGGKYVSPSIAEKLASSLTDARDKAPHELLSVREFQVMRLLSSGKTPSQIASELKLSVQAVSTYRSRILQKLKITNNADLVRYAMQNGLVH
ncbi:MAG: Response regulator, LuxR family [Verrucomicrobiales bacterium]|nr:Response regulator, LuxR family [Verrucomicrobiales bacterium]